MIFFIFIINRFIGFIIKFWYRIKFRIWKIWLWAKRWRTSKIRLCSWWLLLLIIFGPLCLIDIISRNRLWLLDFDTWKLCYLSACLYFCSNCSDLFCIMLDCIFLFILYRTGGTLPQPVQSRKLGFWIAWMSVNWGASMSFRVSNCHSFFGIVFRLGSVLVSKSRV